MSNWEALKAKIAPDRKRKRDETPQELALKKRKKHKGSLRVSKDLSGEQTKRTKKYTSKSQSTNKKTSNGTSFHVKVDDVEAPATASEGLETLVVDKKSSKIGKYLALDCEMVGTNAPPVGPRETSTLARISITNYHGHVIYDSYVSPPPGHQITDYRTWVSGIKPHHLYRAPSFTHVQDSVRQLLKGRILVGHALVNDFKALQFTHPKHMVRDTSTFAHFKQYAVGRTPGLKKIAHLELGVSIQGAEHSSVEDARACMALYRKYKAEFEEKAKQKGLGIGP